MIAQSRVKGEWGVGMDQRDGTYFHLLAQGTAYFSLDSKPEVQMTAGDVVVLPQGAAHSLRSSSNSKVVSLAEFVKNSQAFYSREHDATIVLCGSFEMDRYRLIPAIKSLPSSLHLQADAGSATTPVAEVLKAYAVRLSKRNWAVRRSSGTCFPTCSFTSFDNGRSQRKLKLPHGFSPCKIARLLKL